MEHQFPENQTPPADEPQGQPADFESFSAPEEKNRETEYLKQVFRFTPAETKFVKTLLTGKSVAECAAELGVSVHTARSHLKKVMWKTKTKRQGALIGLLIGHLNRPVELVSVTSAAPPTQ